MAQASRVKCDVGHRARALLDDKSFLGFTYEKKKCTTLYPETFAERHNFEAGLSYIRN